MRCRRRRHRQNIVLSRYNKLNERSDAGANRAYATKAPSTIRIRAGNDASADAIPAVGQNPRVVAAKTRVV